jgi:hypothetical protein
MKKHEWLDLTPLELNLAIDAYRENQEDYYDFLHRLQTGKPLKKKHSVQNAINIFGHLKTIAER